MDINKIYYEILVSHDKWAESLEKTDNSDFIRYNENQHKWYLSICDNIQRVVGIQGGTKEETYNQLSEIASKPLTNEQKKQLSEIRKHPMYKKMMGENALQIKSELEQVLGTKLSSEGITIVSENGSFASIKDEDTLYAELDINSNKLTEFLSNGQITQEQYQRYDAALDSIYTYYVSQSKGEQIPFRKISDSEFEKIEEQAYINGISANEQMMKINQDMLYQFQEVQEAALISKQNGRSI